MSPHPLLVCELRQSKRLQKFFDFLPESSRYQIDREVREVASPTRTTFSVNEYCEPQPPSAALQDFVAQQTRRNPYLPDLFQR